MTKSILARPFPNYHRPVADSYTAATIVCAVGLFLKILLSAPLLNLLGVDYGSDEASTLSKIHPGSYLIIISFIILLCNRRNPFEQLILVTRQHTSFAAFAAIYLVIIVYWVLRGPKGVGLIIDVHIVMPICAIVFSYAQKRYCKAIVLIFFTLAFLNSSVGICESLTHVRLFPFDADWEVLHQDYFRASALMGHPLVNAAFTVVALFVTLGLRIPLPLKAAASLTMLASLIAFGGRSALGFCLIGLAVLSIAKAKSYFSFGQLTVMKITTALLAAVVIPSLCFVVLYIALHSGMGERLVAYSSLQDDSAGVRLLSFNVFNYMNWSDILLGVDGDQIAMISSHAGVNAPSSDIENPWVLMFLCLGAIMFCLWSVGLGACVWTLLVGAPAPLKIAIFEYFFIASMSNSFGRKDPIYMVLAGIIVCAKRSGLTQTLIINSERS